MNQEIRPLQGRIRIFLTLIAAFLFFLSEPCLYSQDYEPVECDSPLPYKGPPLHGKITEDVWENLHSDLTGQPDRQLSEKLEDVAEEILELTKSPAISAAVGIPGKGIWTLSKGFALTEPETPLDPISYFHWASVGKAFTAAAISQLVEENKLTLTDPLANWFPDFPNAGAITIDHLLLHTSGIFNFNSDIPFREKGGYSPPEQLLEIAEKHGNAFCPGEHWAYSNTNYIFLGLILERIEKKPLHQILTERIIKPLNLTNTIALMPRKSVAGLVKGHTKDGPDEQFNETMPFGAGIIVSSAGDMVRFWHGLLSGKLIKQKSIKNAFASLYPMFDSGTYYGRGVMLYDVNDEKGKQVVYWLGHSGGTQGIKTIVAYDMVSRIYVAVALNNQASAEASANKLLKEIKAKLE